MARVRYFLVVILIGVIVIFEGGVTPAHAINCGDVLGPGGNFKLQQDLDCPGFGAAAGFTVKDGANLDLNGHIVTCNSFARCVVLSGVGAQLFDGVVRGSQHENLHVEGTGHTVKNVTAGAADGGVGVFGDNNSLINVMAKSGQFNPALVIAGNNNQLSDSIAQCSGVDSGGGCIEILGDGNRLIDNFASAVTGFSSTNASVLFSINGNNNQLSDSIAQCSALFTCIAVSGDSNRLTDNFASAVTGAEQFFVNASGLSISGNYNLVRRNRVIGNSENNGIVVTGSKNDIRHNTALDNSSLPVPGITFDLKDTNGDCAHNTWKFNTFVTADPACIQ